MRTLAAVTMMLLPAAAFAVNGPVLQYVYGGTGGTVVFIHGKGNCGRGSTSPCGGNPAAYWTNSYNNATLLNEATTKLGASTVYYEAFAIGHDTENQGYWSSANDVAACLRDLVNGTNASGCNPNGYRRTSFMLVGHSAGATIIDRILSSGWWPDVAAAVQGSPVSLQGALAGARSASALYNVDGQGNWVTNLVGWLAGTIGYDLKSAGAWSLTRGNVNNEAAMGHQGKSPRWILKVTTTGGCGSCNNNGAWFCGTGVNEHDNDDLLGAACSAVGYSNDDDSDGILWMHDTDPTANPNGSNGGKYNANYTGYYWHWITSWANHDHGRNDAYTTLGDWQTASGCYTRSPGTCIGQYAF